MIEDEPKPKARDLPLGAPLDTLSVAELEARIALLRQEIARIEQAIAGKRASRDAADSVFRGPPQR
jgi:uncharacterized small protein (DUF1192 family)